MPSASWPLDLCSQPNGRIIISNKNLYGVQKWECLFPLQRVNGATKYARIILDGGTGVSFEPKFFRKLWKNHDHPRSTSEMHFILFRGLAEAMPNVDFSMVWWGSIANHYKTIRFHIDFWWLGGVKWWKNVRGVTKTGKRQNRWNIIRGVAKMKIMKCGAETICFIRLENRHRGLSIWATPLMVLEIFFRSTGSHMFYKVWGP